MIAFDDAPIAPEDVAALDRFTFHGLDAVDNVCPECGQSGGNHDTFCDEPWEHAEPGR